MGFQMGNRAIRQTYQLHGMDIKIHEWRLEYACFANIALTVVDRAIQQAHIHMNGLYIYFSRLLHIFKDLIPAYLRLVVMDAFLLTVNDVTAESWVYSNYNWRGGNTIHISSSFRTPWWVHSCTQSQQLGGPSTYQWNLVTLVTYAPKCEIWNTDLWYFMSYAYVTM